MSRCCLQQRTGSSALLSAEAAAVLGARKQGRHAHLRTTADFNNRINQRRAAVACELGNWRTATNGEGESRFQTLTHLSEPPRTFFPKSSRNTLLITLRPFCGSPRTPADNPELGHLDAIWSSIHLMTSCSLQTTVREPNWICLGKVPSFMRA